VRKMHSLIGQNNIMQELETSGEFIRVGDKFHLR